MKFVYKLFVLFALLLNVMGYDIQGRLELEDGNLKWQEGETRTVMVTFWPIEEVDSQSIKENLTGKDFVEHFFVSKVIEANFSKHNPSAYQIKMNLTLKEYFTRSKPLIWSYKALNIPIDIGNIDILQDPNKINDYVLLNANVLDNESKNYRTYILIFLGIIIFLVTVFFARKFYFKNKLEKEKKQREEHWKILITQASSREDFEMLFKESETWTAVFGGVNPAFQDFLNQINNHQYKKEWNDEVFNDISLTHDQIKDSFDV